MDNYDYEQIDKSISKRVDAIYSDPKLHVFVSIHQLDEDEDRRGIRGGKIRGKKTICGYCGGPKKGHAEKTEQL